MAPAHHLASISRKPHTPTTRRYVPPVSFFHHLLLLRRHNLSRRPLRQCLQLLYKCGRLNHWSCDCSSNATAASTDNPNPNPHTNASRFASYPRSRSTKTTAVAEEEEGSGRQALNKKERVMRPKLTLDLLLSDDGLASYSATSPRPSNPTFALAMRSIVQS
ncbi:hypothetical protein GUJ93_ZPchr0002g25549 [Zizania palustris]|uniref:Uncharacterized protein n=1 Tax=Zizania palustris TaxID=103762 RepID=A0A8J5SBK3_ZIZPA|nr:hypothetical protein GUJ93_ZPchr0002g25549 [Zizania palustris]